MTPAKFSEDPVEGLLGLVADEQLDDAQWERLADLLRNDDQLRQRYVEYLLVDQLLREECPQTDRAWLQDELQAMLRGDRAAPAAVGREAMPVVSVRVPLVRFLNRPVVFSLIFAGSFMFAVLTFLAAYRTGLQEPRGETAQRARAPQHVARVVGKQLVRSEEDAGLSVGRALMAGRVFVVESGLLEIAFESGARVVVEGPAEFAPHTRNALQLLRGRLTATVPPRARGFVVQTPQTSILDLGTKFGVAVEAGETYVEVFEGLVRTLPAKRRAGLDIRQGRAAVVASGAAARPVAPRTRQFAALRRDVPAVPENAGDRLRLTTPTATFSQTAHGGYSVAKAVDDSPTSSWAIARTGQSGTEAARSETAVFHIAQLPARSPDAQGWELCFVLDSGTTTHPDAVLGRFRLSVTDADPSEFADGKSEGGRLGEEAIWTILAPTAWSVAAEGFLPGDYQRQPRAHLERLDDGSLLVRGEFMGCARYTVTARTSLARITGIRLEVLEHPSLPHAGPGRSRQHGNMVLSQLSVYAKAITTTSTQAEGKRTLP